MRAPSPGEIHVVRDVGVYFNVVSPALVCQVPRSPHLYVWAVSKTTSCLRAGFPLALP